MGGCSSKNRHYYLNIYTSEPNLRQWQSIFESLQLKQADIGRLRKVPTVTRQQQTALLHCCDPIVSASLL